jgi:4-amino-4-deoxy-L-arabinose transferase-like glycosyltransferase
LLRPVIAHPVALSVLAGALLRLAHHLGFLRTPFASRPILDAELYDGIARALAAGDWLGAGTPGAPYYANPLFPYLLGVIYRLGGPPATAAVHLVQHGLGLGVVAIIALMAGRVFGRGAALGAGLLAATYRPFLLREEFLVTEPLVVFLGALGLWLTLRAGRAAGHRHTLAAGLGAGLALGAGLLARPTLLPLAALVWLVMTVGLRTAIVCGLGIAIGIAPATLRNAAVAGGRPLTFIPAHGGETFYVGNRRGADGSNLQPDFVRSGPRTEHEDFRREASRRLGSDVDLATASHFWQRTALSEIAADPARWLRLLAKKTALLGNDYEKGDNEDPESLRAMIPAARLPLPGFGLVLALSVLGMLAGGKWGGLAPASAPPPAGPGPAGVAIAPRGASLLGFAAIAYATGCLVIFVTGRYRLPLAVPLLAFAGEGIRAAAVALARAPARRLAIRLAPAGLVFVAALLITHRPLPAADLNDPALAAVNLGVLYESAGDFPLATASYRRAIALRPELALAHFNLGVAERRQGHLATADSAFRAALEIDPRSADALDQLAMTHEQAGDFATALVLYERALAVDPAHPRTYRDLGRLHVLRGDTTAAIVAWERALALAPADSITASRLRALQGGRPGAAQVQ